jgi:putrescine aminotransferase
LGEGALYGLVLNSETGAAFKAALDVAPGAIFDDERFVEKLVASSVVSELYKTHGVLTFFRSNREIVMVVSPALIVTDDELDRFLDALDRTLAEGRLSLVSRFARDYLSTKVSGSRLAGPVRRQLGHG